MDSVPWLTFRKAGRNSQAASFAESSCNGAMERSCYQIKPRTRVNTTVFVDNEFGAGSLDVRRAHELCSGSH